MLRSGANSRHINRIEKDKKIVEQLQKNCRQTIAQIAKITKLPRDIVVYRIKKLESEGKLYQS